MARHLSSSAQAWESSLCVVASMPRSGGLIAVCRGGSSVVMLVERAQLDTHPAACIGRSREVLPSPTHVR
jgi:hypothetical protein